MRIGILNYGMGNIHSIKGALFHLGVTDVVLDHDKSVLSGCDKLILPGVGSYRAAIEKIRELALFDFIQDQGNAKKKPIFGICLGMQLLGQSSTEHGLSKGLSFVDNSVREFNDSEMALPHIGFNQVTFPVDSKLFKGISQGSDFYFVHSYRMVPNSQSMESLCNYGEDFVAAFEVGNIVGTQFHPELSQVNGLKLLTNFIENIQC